MPVAVSYPGVYIEEISSGVRTITGVATSITAFIGGASRGPLDEPVRVQSFGEFERTFGGLWAKSTLGHAVAQFFQNGGGDALVVRVGVGGGASTASVKSIKAGSPAAAGGGDPLKLAAAGNGTWGDSLHARVEPAPGDATNTVFNLTVLDAGSGVSEQFLNLSTDPTKPRFVTRVLEQGSSLVRAVAPVPATLVPDVAVADATKPPILDPALSATFAGGGDGTPITDAALSDPGLEAAKKGIWALEKADLFNLLCIPPLAADTDIGMQTRNAAAAYCQKRRAVFIVDPLLAWTSHSTAIAGVDNNFMTRTSYAALFFPFIKAPDPLLQGQIADFAPCGAVAGIFARTDAGRGVWKAPAGIDATIGGAAGLAVKLTDGENGQLNPIAINSLRAFPNIGPVVWGSRTLDGFDQKGSEWKYIPVRRLALYIEESLFRGTQWVVFEPNDEPLWAQIRLNLGAFMHDLFRQGAFQGKSPAEAYFVKCDKDTTTQNDINLGIVNIVVGFAPLKPAEFVIIKIQQIAGQIAS